MTLSCQSPGGSVVSELLSHLKLMAGGGCGASGVVTGLPNLPPQAPKGRRSWQVCEDCLPDSAGTVTGVPGAKDTNPRAREASGPPAQPHWQPIGAQLCDVLPDSETGHWCAGRDRTSVLLSENTTSVPAPTAPASRHLGQMLASPSPTPSLSVHICEMGGDTAH